MIYPVFPLEKTWNSFIYPHFATHRLSVMSNVMGLLQLTMYLYAGDKDDNEERRDEERGTTVCGTGLVNTGCRVGESITSSLIPY